LYSIDFVKILLSTNENRSAVGLAEYDFVAVNLFDRPLIAHVVGFDDFSVAVAIVGDDFLAEPEHKALHVVCPRRLLRRRYAFDRRLRALSVARRRESSLFPSFLPFVRSLEIRLDKSCNLVYLVLVPTSIRS
jgi:hypothetical protein